MKWISTITLLFFSCFALAEEESKLAQGNERIYKDMYLVTELPSGFEENYLKMNNREILNFDSQDKTWNIRFEFFNDPGNKIGLDFAINGLNKNAAADEKLTLVNHREMFLGDRPVYYFKYHYMSMPRIMTISEYFVMEAEQGTYVVSFSAPRKSYDYSFVKAFLESTFFGKSQS